MSKIKHPEKLLRKLEKIDNLFGFTPTIKKVIELISEENIPLNKIAKTIEKDPELTARILRLANSPFYGIPKRIATIEAALILLGTTTLRLLLISSLSFRIFNKNDTKFKEHSINTAFCARCLSEKANLINPQEMFIAGLLHDLGKIVLKTQFPKEYRKVLILQNKGLSVCEAEKEVFKMDHAEVGSILMEKWNFPQRLIESIKAHHNLNLANKYKKEAMIIQLADKIAHIKNEKDKFEEKLVLNSQVFAILNISISEIKEILKTLESHSSEAQLLIEEIS